MSNKTFRLHWKVGNPQEITGPNIAAAFALAGIGAGALGALDYYEEVKPPMTQAECKQKFIELLRHVVTEAGAIDNATPAEHPGCMIAPGWWDDMKDLQAMARNMLDKRGVKVAQ